MGSTVNGAFLLADSVMEDLRFPSSGINPPGAATDPTRSQTTGLLEFDAGADRVIAGNFQMPHGWKAGSIIVPHIHVLCTTASTNVSKWRFDYAISNPMGTRTPTGYGNYTTGTVTTLTNPNNVNLHYMHAVTPAPIDMTGYTESCVMEWRLSRLNTGNTDTGTIVLLDFDVHYYAEKLGKNL